MGAVIGSLAGRAVASVGIKLKPEKVHELRNGAMINCSSKNSTCKPLIAPCLFNVQQDPCEENNLANEFPTILKKLQEEIKKFNDTAIPPGNLPWDDRGNPELWDHTWNNFGDYSDIMTTIMA